MFQRWVWSIWTQGRPFTEFWQCPPLLMNLSSTWINIFMSKNIPLNMKAHINKINKNVHMTIFPLLSIHMDWVGREKILPWKSANTESSLLSLYKARTIFISRAFFLLCFIYSCLSLTESSVFKVNFFWVTISLFSLKGWLQRADQNRGQVDNQSRISRKALAGFKVFQRGACWGQRQH